MSRILTCTCGDCKHWELHEISAEEAGIKYHSLKCVTCGIVFPLTTDEEGGIIIPEADHLVWVEN
jgi:hypothetical protein